MVLNDLGNVVNHTVSGYLRIIRAGAHHQERPAEHTHQQGYGSLVDFGHTLQGYTEVANTEDGDNQDC